MQTRPQDSIEDGPHTLTRQRDYSSCDLPYMDTTHNQLDTTWTLHIDATQTHSSPITFFFHSLL